MGGAIGKIGVRVRVTPAARQRGAALVRELRAMLPEALMAAVRTAADSGAGVVLVPRITASMRGSLRGLRGSRVARVLAQASIAAAVERSAPVAAQSDESGTAQTIVETLRSGTSVRCRSLAEAGAAWLVALILDEPGVLRSLTPFADLQHRSSGAAFAEVCGRTGDAGAVVAALGRSRAIAFAARCTAGEAAAVLRSMAEEGEPAADTWAFLAGRVDAALRAGDETREVRLLRATIEGRFDHRPGVVAAAQTLLRTMPRPQPSDASQGLPLESNLTGLWLLWPYLSRHVDGHDERAMRGIALALGEFLGGAIADDDPALAVLCNDGESPHSLRAAAPAGLQIERLAVALVRDFARSLTHFERARCGYILRAILSGPGSVIRTPGGAEATLPHSPLRVVLERAALLGPLDVPWRLPCLALVRDDA